MITVRAYTVRTPRAQYTCFNLSQTCFEAYTHRLYMCADVVMLIRDVATRDMVEDKLFWDVSKTGGRGRCIKFPGLPSTTPPLI